MSLAREAARRRTYAIISHPDAGKTTITEKLLLYSGAIHLAGSVRGRKTARLAVSDWMQMEQERGISITSSVLQFEHRGSVLNLLDTPGHADFSEDTYRTLAAVDSAVMLMDHTKGVESRTLKLFEVCRMRKLPVITFMNKLDRDGLDPLGLLDEVGNTLALRVCPMNWPVGMGKGFVGIIDLVTEQLCRYSGGKHGSKKLETETIPWSDARDLVGHDLYDETTEQLELLDMAGEAWDRDLYLTGELTPVFWGSAMTNFGVEPLLHFLADEAAPPREREASEAIGKQESVLLAPTDDQFSAFVFKIQANMNPRHRDRMAFIRIVSGRFERGMDVKVGRTGATMRLSRPHTVQAQERSVVQDAWPGDIVGLYDPGNLRIGDTLTTGKRLEFGGIPRFAPEFFARPKLEDPLKRKQLDQGLEQLGFEGVIQVFYRPEIGRQEPWLGAVGLLQLEVLKERLKNEYSVPCTMDLLRWKCARWFEAEQDGLDWLERRRDFQLVEDRHGRPVVLTEAAWAIDFAMREAPGLKLYDVEPL
jgi:peptide chain release factor 3